MTAPRFDDRAAFRAPPYGFWRWGLLGALLLGLTGWLPEGSLASPLRTLDAFLALAETHHPELRAAAAELRAAQARLRQIGARGGVLVDASASENRISDGSSRHALGITAGVKLYDAGKDRRDEAAQRRTVAAAEAEARTVLLRVRTDVRRAYVDLLLAGARKRQAQDTVAVFERHLATAQGFYEAGTKPRIDVTKAEVDLGNAQTERLKAESAENLARAALAAAAGLEDLAPFDPEEIAWDRIKPPSEETARRWALKKRPDYRAALLREEAARLATEAAARGDAPTATLQGSWGYDGTEFPLDEGGRVGISLSWSVTDAGTTRSAVAESRAREDARSAASALLRQRIALEIRTALLALEDARSRETHQALVVRQAEEMLALATGRYDAGVGSALEVTDAVLALNDARLGAYQARHDEAVALADLTRAVGDDDWNAIGGSAP